ncbi:MAG: efflux RND transporter permease subunit [Myxococcota bacterium]|nr:efflux RND transporter permease subunit [Myxococcota bacterium]
MTALLDLLRRHAAAVWFATLILVGLGVAAALSLPSGIYPEVEFPRIVVVARTGGAPADVFLTNVTRPLEQTLTTVLGLQRIRSKTIRGATEISLQFTPDTDMWRALQLVESHANEVRGELPPGSELLVERVTTGSFPVVTFNLSGAVDPRELRELAELVVRPTLAGVGGVGRIEVLGGDVREVEVILDPESTAALHLTPSRVADAMRTAMGLSAVGRVDRDRQLVTLIGDAQPKSIADIREMPLTTAPDGVTVPLGAIAEVVDGHEDRLVRVGGPRGNTVVLSVARLPGASTTTVVETAIAAAHELAASLPAGVTLTPVYDQARLVRESMASVRDAILIGIFLCAAVVGVFLRDVRAGLLAGVSVPLTLAVTFLAMRLAGQTLNLMSLGGMAVAIGLVVDDAIVMIEAIARHRDAGADVRTATVDGTLELAPAVIGTTLTTVVVFVPLAFLGGVVGDFFRALAFTVTSAVLVSLAVALALVPLAAAWTLSPAPHAERRRLLDAYDRVLRVVVPRPLVAALALLVVIAAGVAIVPALQRGFLPQMDEGAFVIDYFLPAGTSLATTEAYALRIEAELRSIPEVRTFSRRLGAEMGPAAATQLNRGDIMVSLTSTRSRASSDVVADLRARIEQKYPEVRVEFVQVLQDVLNDLAGNPRPLEVKVFGPDYAELHRIADDLAGRVHDVPGLVDLYDGNEREAPELRYTMRRDTIARLGMTPDDVSLQLDSALAGTRVGAIRRFDRLVGVRVRYPDPVRFDPERVLRIPFVAGDKTTLFEAVADPKAGTSPSMLLHEALQPMVTVTADTENRDIGSVADEVTRKARDIVLPKGYRMVLGGQAESQRETVRQLATVGAFALVLVLTVLAAQFRRLLVAALVLGSVPVAIVGAFGALLVTGTPLNASSLMGCVLLVGLVVKNGVLLLEAAEKTRDLGEDPIRAVTLAAERRLRPVAMTTLATLAGLFPLALGIGAGAELQRPLAIAVIGGLVTSTLATLGILPPLAAAALRLGKPVAEK